MALVSADTPEKNIIMKFTRPEAERVWLISDTHFDHENIIRYCNRPFHSVEEMNSVILRNWNRTIRPGDLVYFLGDMSFGRGSKSPKWWLKRLNGRIIYIKGSHDLGIRPSSVLPKVTRVSNFEYVGIDDLNLLLVHDPVSPAVNGWDGWIIHGHSHDNHPFLNLQKKRVNVSVEVTNYRPVSLAEVIKHLVSLPCP